MAAPKTTIWTLDPHTRAKHAILKRYLQAWTPILTQTGFKQIAYIDGFAGPGRYVGGEEGSPIIALRAALDHSARINSTVMFLFVEKDPERARVLEEIIDSMLLPSNFFVRIDGGITFEDSFEKFIRNLRSRNQNLPPIFAFIDPFGWTGAPFNIVKFILGQKSCEVLITFMYEEINRFIGHPDQIGNFDTFFGTGDWRECLILSKPKERNRFLHELYLRQLKTVARARYVRSFQMRNESGLIDYYLFYATNSLRGLQKMKEAIWKIDESGEFTFLDATDPNQTVLFSKEPRYEDLKRQILSRFSGQEITVGEIEEFVLAETAFRDTHYKVQVLKPLERAHPPRIQIIDAPPNRKHGTFGSSLMRLRFI